MLLPQTMYLIPQCEESVLQKLVPVLSFTVSPHCSVCNTGPRWGSGATVSSFDAVGLILEHKLDISASLCRTGCLKITSNKVLKFRLCWFLLICVCSFQFLMGNNIVFLNQVLAAI